MMEAFQVNGYMMYIPHSMPPIKGERINEEMTISEAVDGVEISTKTWWTGVVTGGH